ncbi:DUF2867 domain-containing protein [Streptomyces sp. NPDC091272]|uniref:DUF2867 domain-containing protein n=1 Tax=Streptomyces sp. NPDC091272 TaxID=3365981 RepID=UPI00382A6E00
MAPAPLTDHDYRDDFITGIRAGDRRSPAQWMRAITEQAPQPMRFIIPIGWRVALGLRRHLSPDNVFGLPVLDSTADRCVLEGRSARVTFHIVVTLDEDNERAALTTLVRFENRLGRFAWVFGGPIHRSFAPHMLRRAASSRPRRTECAISAPEVASSGGSPPEAHS